MLRGGDGHDFDRAVAVGLIVLVALIVGALLVRGNWASVSWP